MVTQLFGAVWSLLKLPVKLVLLPFKILSMIVSLIVYGILLLVLSGAIYVFLL